MKLALGGLSILLIGVITVSYYMNKEGFYVTSVADAETALLDAKTAAASAKTAAAAAASILTAATAAAAAAPTDTAKSSALTAATAAANSANAAKGLAEAKVIVAEKALHAARKESRHKRKGNGSTTYTPVIGGTGGANASRPVAPTGSSSASKDKNKNHWAKGYPISDNDELLRAYKRSIKDITRTPDMNGRRPSSRRSSPKQPQVSISETGYDAMELNQQSSLLKNIQKIIRNELIATRNTEPVHSNTKKHSDSSADKQGDEYKSAQGKKWNGVAGREDPSNCAPYQSSSSKKRKNADTDSDSDDDCAASSYIKKNEIPCWGCNLDY